MEFAPNRLLEAIEKMVDQKIASALTKPDPYPQIDWSDVVYGQLQALQEKL